MTDVIIWFAVIVVVLTVFFAVQSNIAKKAKKEKIEKYLNNTFGKRPNREYRNNEYDRISGYFESCVAEGKDEFVDEITWNDISMDNIFKLINNTNSSVGEEYLYKLLRTINFNQNELDEIESLSEYFVNNPNKAKELQVLFVELGRTRSVSFFDFIHGLKNVKIKSNFIHYLCIVLGLSALSLFFVNSAVAVASFILVFSFNIFTYYKYKAEVGHNFVCCKYLVKLVDMAENLSDKDVHVLEKYNKTMKADVEKLSMLQRNMYLISDGNMNDSVIGIILEYVKILFHVDLIKFNSTVKETSQNMDVLEELYKCLGRIESILAIASFKTMLVNEYGAYAKPIIIRDDSRNGVEFTNIYHPLIRGAVKNSMSRESDVLLTGSNASGKSTFLKTVAINTILAQTIGVVCAESFECNETLVYSSMALRDDLESNESYYIVEIKSLKRIIDRAQEGKHKVMCFIDEVLRGTNTVERIAASSVILEKIAGADTICFAATHDIELTTMLSDSFANYHFEEEVVEDDVLFNYELRIGPATTRNAIKLLKLIGYDKPIIDKASERAENFMKNNVW